MRVYVSDVRRGTKRNTMKRPASISQNGSTKAVEAKKEKTRNKRILFKELGCLF
jgi:hypothetical protein